MNGKPTQYAKRFAWLPVKARGPRGHFKTIWFRFYYEKKVYVSGPLVTGWLIHRSLQPFPTRHHLKVVK